MAEKNYGTYRRCIEAYSPWGSWCSRHSRHNDLEEEFSNPNHFIAVCYSGGCFRSNFLRVLLYVSITLRSDFSLCNDAFLGPVLLRLALPLWLHHGRNHVHQKSTQAALPKHSA